MSTINVTARSQQMPAAVWHGARTLVADLWQTNWLLTLTTMLFAAQFLNFAGMALIDDTVITGANAWFKPMKFAMSSVFYIGTITWMIGHVKSRPRLVNFIGYGLGAILLGEIAIVAFQAARGVASHFNFATALDGALFSTMGSMILVLSILTLILALILAFEKMQDRPLAWSMRFGVFIAFLAAIPGYMMVAPTPAQQAALAVGEEVTVIGAHSVGVADGGPGLPFLGWSTEGGDLRPAHFLGLHALQIIPLLGLAIRRRWRGHLSERREIQLIATAGVSYAALMFIMIWQAERGQSIIRPDLLTAGVLALWLGFTAGAGLTLLRSRRATE